MRLLKTTIWILACLYATANITAQDKCISFAADSEPYDVIAIEGLNNIADFTIETWLYINNFSSYGPQIGSDNKTDGCRIKFSPSDIKIWTTTENDWAVSNDNNSSFGNKWSHFAFTYSNGTASVYVNGQQIGTTSTLLQATSFLNFTLGTAHTKRFLDGKMEEFRLWDKALTKEEINSYMKRKQFSMAESNNLLIHYDFDQIINNQIQNISNPGVYNGIPTFKALDEALIPSDAFVPENPVKAQFSADNNICTVTKSVTFINTSQGSDLSYSWSFPGGQPSTSSSASPSVQYSTPGTYDVTLTAISGEFSSVLTRKGYIWVGENVHTALQSVELDGNDDYVKIPTPLNNRITNYTIEFWIYLKSMGSSSYLSPNKPAPFYFGCNENGKIKVGFDEEFEMEDNDLSNDSTCVIQTEDNAMELYKWQHFAFVFDKGKGILYKNGIQIGQNATITFDAPGWDGHTFSDYMTIGSSQSANTMQGQIDEFRVWNSSRSGNSIKEYLTQKIYAVPDDLVTYLRFDDVNLINDTIVENINNLYDDGILRNFDTQEALQPSGAFSTDGYIILPAEQLKSNYQIPFSSYSDNNTLYIKSSSPYTYSYTIYDTNAQQIVNHSDRMNTSEISGLKAGVYLIRVSCNNQTYTLKVKHF